MDNMLTEVQGRVYSISDVADRLHLRYKTIWKWVRIDKTVQYVIYPSGTIRIPEAELLRLLGEQQHARRDDPSLT